MSGFLDQAFEQAEARVQRWKREDLLQRLLHESSGRPVGSRFADGLRAAKPVAVIAEIKRSSPSKGVLCSEVNVAERTADYFAGGATAVSILTESRWFGGALEDLIAARRSSGGLLLRKDFLEDEYDLQVSAAVGASAVLLIASRFCVSRLRDLIKCAKEFGLCSLVETHDERDAATALESGAKVIGVNSRNLRTLEVDFSAALAALRNIPSDRVRVLESGVRSPSDVRAAVLAGANAVLIGEWLMRSPAPRDAIRSLLCEVEAGEALQTPRDRKGESP